MSEIVYPPVIGAAKLLFRVLDVRVRVQGGDWVPRTGGAVIACNHVSYLDFIFCGFRERFNCWKTFYETFKIRNHRVDLRLL